MRRGGFSVFKADFDAKCRIRTGLSAGLNSSRICDRIKQAKNGNNKKKNGNNKQKKDETANRGGVKS